MEAQEMRLLLRGQLVLTVHAKRNPDLRLRGVIGARISCDIFDSIVTSFDSLQEPAVSSTATGLAWMYFGRNGQINYR